MNSFNIWGKYNFYVDHVCRVHSFFYLSFFVVAAFDVKDTGKGTRLTIPASSRAVRT